MTTTWATQAMNNVQHFSSISVTFTVFMSAHRQHLWNATLLSWSYCLSFFQELVNNPFLSLISAGLYLFPILRVCACVMKWFFFSHLLWKTDSVLGGRSLSPPGKSRVGAFKDENDLAIFFGLEKASLMIIVSMRCTPCKTCSFHYFVWCFVNICNHF